jgi:hypothetical protein
MPRPQRRLKDGQRAMKNIIEAHELGFPITTEPGRRLTVAFRPEVARPRLDSSSFRSTVETSRQLSG